MNTDLTMAQAAKRLGVSRQRIHVLKDTGRLKARRLGFQYVVKMRDVETLKASIGKGHKGGRPRKQEKVVSSLTNQA